MLESGRIAAIDSFVAGHWVFVRVTIDSGATGWGEATYFVHPPAIHAVIADLRAAYVGEDPWRPEYLYQRVLKKHCLVDAAASCAMSAIDQALWDLKGKALDVPVWQLLGGRVRDRIRAILLIEAGDADGILTEAVRARDQGFTAIKIKPFTGDWSVHSTVRILDEAAGTVHAVRAAIGPDVDLAVEVHRNLSPDQAIAFAGLVRGAQLCFLEDPVLPFSVTVNRHVARYAGMPVAIAERNLTIWEFREYSDCESVTYLRPDAGVAGGITQLRKIAAIAESRQQRIVPHNFTSPLLTAVHLQLAACTVNWELQGYVREHREPWTRVVRQVNHLEDGFLRIPESPGIGIEPDAEYLATASYEPFGSRFGHIAHPAMDGGIKQV
jgi:galactonate dehydratase